LKNGICHHHAVGHCRQTAVRNDADGGKRIEIHSQDGQNVVRSQRHERRLGSENAIEALALPGRQFGPLPPQKNDRSERLGKCHRENPEPDAGDGVVGVADFADVADEEIADVEGGQRAVKNVEREQPASGLHPGEQETQMQHRHRNEDDAELHEFGPCIGLDWRAGAEERVGAEIPNRDGKRPREKHLVQPGAPVAAEDKHREGKIEQSADEWDVGEEVHLVVGRQRRRARQAFLPPKPLLMLRATRIG
jgi:hypothetical protein